MRIMKDLENFGRKVREGNGWLSISFKKLDFWNIMELIQSVLIHNELSSSAQTNHLFSHQWRQGRERDNDTNAKIKHKLRSGRKPRERNKTDRSKTSPEARVWRGEAGRQLRFLYIGKGPGTLIPNGAVDASFSAGPISNGLRLRLVNQNGARW